MYVTYSFRKFSFINLEKLTLVNKSLLIILPATDFNEEEYLTIKNILEISGFRLFIASDAHSLCVGNNNLKVRADVSFFNIHETNFAGIIFIGGNGVRNYWDNKTLHLIAKKFFEKKKMVAAICNAPVLLAKAGILAGKDATCYPDDKRELEKEGINYVDIPVVIQRNVITAQQPSSSNDFANSIVNLNLK